MDTNIDLSNAERQANYRERQKFGNQNRRLNAWVNKDAFTVLGSLSSKHGATKRQVLEALLTTFEDDLFLNEKLADLGKKAEKVAKKRGRSPK